MVRQTAAATTTTKIKIIKQNKTNKTCLEPSIGRWKQYPESLLASQPNQNENFSFSKRPMSKE